MGTAPPPDGPPPAVASAAASGASFSPGPPVKGLCGFALPTVDFSLGFNPKLPFKFPPAIPKFSPSVGLNCSTSNPLDVSAGLPWGGGRVSQSDPNPDDLVAQQTQ